VLAACPTDDDLVLMVEGGLAPAQIAHLETHVDSCATCAAVVANLGAFAPKAPADHAGLVPVDPDHYVVGDELARGGMGRIMRARDRRLGRAVAIKETFVKGDSARRFEREAKITARLQHPSIVQLHEAGVWPSGEPFFAMQLVAGRALADVVAGTKTLDERLALLPNVLAVADAIAYAHSQRVIHRDLKPRNVLVGEFGETIVIDWGLAKDLAAPDEGETFALGSDPELTEHGTVMGTPAYMPPEQALGEQVDERADVYALGALLFHVLSGRAPVVGHSSQEVLATVVSGGVTSLADVEPDVPPDLLAIVAKAMAFEPEDRYPSARELAHDLRRFQTGQLVSAHRYSAGQLARRWLRKHKTAVTVVAGALVVLVAFGVLSIRQILQAEDVAKSERAAALRNRGDAEELMGFMLGEMRQKLEPIGKLELLDTVAKKATTYYERRDSKDLNDLRQHAIAVGNLADVLLSQGHIAEAVTQYRTALAETQVLVAIDPSNELYQRTLAVRHNHLGAALAIQGDTNGALAEYRQDLAISSRVAAAAPNDAHKLRDLSVTHEKIADELDTQGHMNEALAEYRASLELSEQIARLAPSDNAQRDLSVAHQRIGDSLAGHGDIKSGLAEYQLSRTIRAQLATKDPTNTDWQRDLAAIDNSLGELQMTIGDFTASMTALENSLVINEKLAARDPSNADWQSALAWSHYNLGKTLRKQQKYDAALPHYRAALAIQEKMLALDPTHTDRIRDVAQTHRGLGEILEHKDPSAALAEYNTMLPITEKLAALDPANAMWQRDLAMAHEKIGHAHDLMSQWDPAIAEYRECLAIRARLADKDPTNNDFVNDVAVAHYNLGATLTKKDVAAAVAELRLSVELSDKLVAREPDNLSRLSDVADSREMIANRLLTLHDKAGARAEFDKALVALAQLAKLDADNDQWPKTIAKLQAELAHAR